MKLDEPKSIRVLWVIGLAILALVMLVDLFVHHHTHFEQDGITIDTMPEFYPLYGFAACFLLVVVSKTLAIALKRKDTFYADD
jgi:hypothetical protein